jgi:hypothetical protein
VDKEWILHLRRIQTCTMVVSTFLKLSLCWGLSRVQCSPSLTDVETEVRRG